MPLRHYLKDRVQTMRTRITAKLMRICEYMLNDHVSRMYCIGLLMPFPHYLRPVHPHQVNQHGHWQTLHTNLWVYFQRHFTDIFSLMPGAKEPDHWTTCNTVEYEGALLLKSQPYKMGPEIFMKEITVPKNIALSDCRAVEFIVSIAIAESSMNSRLRSGN